MLFRLYGQRIKAWVRLATEGTYFTRLRWLVQESGPLWWALRDSNECCCSEHNNQHTQPQPEAQPVVCSSELIHLITAELTCKWFDVNSD